MLLRHLDALNNRDMTKIDVRYNVATVAQFDGEDVLDKEDFVVNTTAFAHATVELAFVPDDLDIRHQSIRESLEIQINLQDHEIINDFYVV